MLVKIDSKNDILVITISGSIDSKTAGELQNHIMEKVASFQKVLMNLAAVDFLSSAGLRVLLLIYRQLKANNGKVVLTGVSDEIRDVMTMTGFINFFELFNTLEEAENSF